MIKASKFSLQSGSLLSDSISQFKIPEENKSGKDRIWFLSGDMTYYGHKDVKMNQEGYNIIKQSILNTNNSSKGPSIGQSKCRQALAQQLSYQDLQLQENDVFLLHGANIGLLHSILSIVNEGENILIPEPSYPFYQKIAKALNIDARPYKLLPDKQWEVDLSYMESLIDDKTKYIWIVNPSNPCGSVFSKKHIKEILDLALKHQKLVISDEVYYNETFENVEYTCFGHVNPEQPVIVIGGMEKTFCVPGWCVSWMAFYDKYDVLKDVKQAIQKSCGLINSPPEIISSGLPQILDKLTLNFTKKLMPIFEESYNHCYKLISQIQGLTPIKAQGTFYLSVLIDLNIFKEFKNDIEFLQRLLDEQNVFILSLSCFGGGVNGFRLMSAAPIDYYKGFIERLQQFCEKYSK